MAMEARSAAISRFGPTFHEKLVVGIERTGKAAGKFSGLLMPFLDIPAVKTLGEKLTGIASRRSLPPFAKESLFEQIPLNSGNGSPRILYFAGCYAGYLRPSIGNATISVMSSMGMTVLIPKQHCCGLPMLAKGMIQDARKSIEANFSSWGRLIASADYLAVSCSSCGLALMQEWSFLEDSVFVQTVRKKLIHISRLINHYSGRLRTEPSQIRLFYHAPCHLKAQPESDSSMQMLRGLKGAVIESPATHCCGMAGAFGYEQEHHAASMQMAELSLLPAVRNATDAIIVADGTSCRHQIW
ncbi:MAG: heterodisulfide reductase-related iron-sulfur binding cluster, partial [Deltaproteobacteria bacterium]|nr:heterodisulfide reductase-related iron-sulfur binding cluster [Deltaproteobacteria bacterium]